jgi:hypothetical protein
MLLETQLSFPLPLVTLSTKLKIKLDKTFAHDMPNPESVDATDDNMTYPIHISNFKLGKMVIPIKVAFYDSLISFLV